MADDKTQNERSKTNLMNTIKASIDETKTTLVNKIASVTKRLDGHDQNLQERIEETAEIKSTLQNEVTEIND